MEEERYYYKQGESGYIVLKEQLEEPLPENVVELTKEQYEQEMSSINARRLQNQRNANMSAKKQIQLLKSQLAETDYQALKYAEGWISEEDYAPIKAHRQSLRDQINVLEESIENEQTA